MMMMMMTSYLQKLSAKISLQANISRGVHSSEAIMHFSPYFRIPPISDVWVGRTLEYVLPGCGYSRVRPTRMCRTLEYATTKEECTLESKSCLESVAAPTPAPSFVS